MAQTLKCSHCHMQLWYAQSPPRTVTCPNCLRVVPNPGPTSGRPSVAPRQVIPIEEETANDVVDTTRDLAVLAAVLLLAGALATLYGGVIWFGIVFIIAGIAVGAGAAITHRRLSNGNLLESGPQPVDFRTESGVLDYAHHKRAKVRSRVSIGAFLLGFFSAIGLGAICFFILAASADTSKANVGERWFFFLLVIGLLIGLVVLANRVGRNPRFNGIGRGVAIGLLLAMMALGPCAFCYLGTLGV